MAGAGAIGIIAISAWERFKGGSRVEFRCGLRALGAYRTLRDTVADISVTLTCAPTPSGSHPAAALACAELRGAGEDGGRPARDAPRHQPDERGGQHREDEDHQPQHDERDANDSSASERTAGFRAQAKACSKSGFDGIVAAPV